MSQQNAAAAVALLTALLGMQNQVNAAYAPIAAALANKSSPSGGFDQFWSQFSPWCQSSVGLSDSHLAQMNAVMSAQLTGATVNTGPFLDDAWARNIAAMIAALQALPS